MREVKNNPNPLNPYAQEEIIEQNSGGTVIYSDLNPYQFLPWGGLGTM